MPSLVKKVVLVNMPWHSLHYPSLALGLLKSLAGAECPEWEVVTSYGNIVWADWAAKRLEISGFANAYTEISEHLFMASAGDWVFSPALHGCDRWQVDEYRDAFPGTDQQFDLALKLHLVSTEFVTNYAADLVGQGASLYGFTSTFTQNVPSLAMARAIKALNPKALIVMGGGNCDGEQGKALHRNFPFLDFVVSGEGEDAFTSLLASLAEDNAQRYFDVPGLCWRTPEEHTQVCNAPGPSAELNNLPIPNYDEYFDDIADAIVGTQVEPQLVMETARGCWWGEKHHCTFCGLNGSGMKFRSKSAARALAEVEELSTRYKTLDVIVVDNILDTNYFNTFLPHLADKGWDMRLHYEIKSNVSDERLRTLRDAGVLHVQPGIESLSAEVLKLMDKGVTGAQNIQILRDGEEAHLTISWNVLVGFPGESAESYDEMLRQARRLHHLQPPVGVSRIILERFSPYFNKPWLGFERRSVSRMYPIVYGLPEDALEDMVYLFDTPPKGIGDDIVAKIQLAVDDWEKAYQTGGTLTFYEDGEGIIIKDRRSGWPMRNYALTESEQTAIFDLLRKPIKRAALMRHAESKSIARERVEVVLAQFESAGIVYSDSGWFVRLPTINSPFRSRPNNENVGLT